MPINLRYKVLKFITACLGFLATGANGGTDDWPQWRGPDRDATVQDAKPWPSSLKTLEERWRVPLGPGYSGPIVSGQRVFVAETLQKTHEVVRAIDRSTGKELWQTKWTGAMKVPFFARANGDWIRSTPAFDGSSLFVGGMRDVLVCLDAENGEKKWRLDFPKDLDGKVPAFGMVSSPLVSNDSVFVHAGGGFVRVDKSTGQIIWKILDDGGAMNSAFSSPVIETIGGTRQVLVQMRKELCGVDISDGRILWRKKVPAFRGMNILTPTVYKDGIFTSTYKNRSFFYQLAKNGDSFEISESWTLPAQAYMSSPVIIDRFAYLHLGNGRLSCIDLEEGVQAWRTRSFGKYWSMAVNKNRILALDERGELLLIDANPKEFQLLDRKTVSDQECWAHVAVSGQQVLVRDLAGVTLFDWK